MIASLSEGVEFVSQTQIELPGTEGKAQASQEFRILDPGQGQCPTQAGRQGRGDTLALDLGHRECADDVDLAAIAQGVNIQSSELILGQVGKVRDEDLDQTTLQFRPG